MKTLEFDVSKLEEGQALLFTTPANLPAFLLKSKSGINAFLNQCAHMPIELDYDDGDFYHSDLDKILCKTHGALFEPDSGVCIAGPCSGKSLIKLKTIPEGSGKVVVVFDS